MAVETIIEEQFAVDHAVGSALTSSSFRSKIIFQAKGKDPKDDGPAFALLAICLSIAMWAYEGGWVQPLNPPAPSRPHLISYFC